MPVLFLPVFGLYYFEGDRGPVSSVTASTIQFNNGAGSNVIHQNDPTDDVYQAFNAGDVIEVSGSTSNDGLYEVLYRDSSVGWSGIIVDRDLTTEAAGSSVTIKKHSVGEKYIALSDADNGVIDIWTQSSDSWSPSEITIASGSNLQSAIKAVYHFVDNVLRIADANFGNSSKVKWYGFIERIHFADEDGNSANSSDVFLGFMKMITTLLRLLLEIKLLLFLILACLGMVLIFIHRNHQMVVNGRQKFGSLQKHLFMMMAKNLY